MYLEHFGLNRKPFSTTPDPRFLFLSSKHREGLAHLLFGTQADSSFVLLTGEIGTGKTTLCRTLLEKPPEDIHVALILNPLQTPYELLASICDEFGITYRSDTQSRKVLVDRINVFLLQKHSAGQRCILIIDEAQNLSIKTLEQIRLLTNLETGDHKLLKIMLIGQPELKLLLERPELKQLNQRITARYHLLPLSEKETASYLGHRIFKAGGKTDIFSTAVAKKIHKLANGVPRVINLIAERALLGAYALNRHKIDKKLVARAANEVLGKSGHRFKPTLANLLMAASFLLAVLAISLAGLNIYLQKEQSEPVTSKQPVTTENLVQDESEKPETILTVHKQANAAAVAEINADISDTQQADKTELADLNSLLNQQKNQPAAIDSLFTRWGIPPYSLTGNSACEKAAQVKLDCIYRKGSFAELTGYDRPAVLEITDQQNNRHQILLSAIQGENAEIIIDGEKQNVTVNELLYAWNGDFLLFWRLPPDGSKIVRPESSGESIAWLHKQLDSVLGNASEQAASRHFGKNLKQKLIEFQTMAGLNPDGVAGPQTLIKLATFRADADTPRLLPSKSHGAK
ncbi:MAG TPA: AAA family ATPase [Chromatiales bacterium]|nr:AAA family ATPase [Thiotrichales bacterium]HIP69003.1 AAA family ATPase [Chromatiales bacterium]